MVFSRRSAAFFQAVSRPDTYKKAIAMTTFFIDITAARRLPNGNVESMDDEFLLKTLIDCRLAELRDRMAKVAAGVKSAAADMPGLCVTAKPYGRAPRGFGKFKARGQAMMYIGPEVTTNERLVVALERAIDVIEKVTSLDDLPNNLRATLDKAKEEMGLQCKPPLQAPPEKTLPQFKLTIHPAARFHGQFSVNIFLTIKTDLVKSGASDLRYHMRKFAEGITSPDEEKPCLWVSAEPVGSEPSWFRVLKSNGLNILTVDPSTVEAVSG